MNSDAKKKKNLSSVDIAKLLFAIGVVMIHTGCISGTDLGSWLVMHGVLRLAVPFFFCAAGFFFCKSLEKSNNIKSTTRNYIKRLLVPFCFWLLVNLPFVIHQLASNGDSFLKIVARIARNLVFYPWGAMWFVSALICGNNVNNPFL